MHTPGEGPVRFLVTGTHSTPSKVGWTSPRCSAHTFTAHTTLRGEVVAVPRRPDAACAGGCGTMLGSSHGSLPAGERTCRPCRREIARVRWLTVACSGCGTTIDRTDRAGGRRWCPACSAELRRARDRRKNARRRGARGWGRYTVLEIAERDGWRCHLCGLKVDPTTPRTAPRGATVDHLVPIGAGGQDVRENVALAHRACNVRRKDRGEVQLLLVG